MTIQQKNAALEIGENLDYTGYYDVLVDADGKWVSPAEPGRIGPDVLLFVWSRQDDGEYGYAYVPRNGDVVGDFVRKDSTWQRSAVAN